MANVKADDLAAALQRELAAYSQEVTDGVKQAVKAVSKETAAQIKRDAPRDTGDYAKGWTYKVEYESENDIRVRIYNRRKPQLTHLLEHGHAKTNGGRVEGRPHIGPAEREAEKQLDGKVKVVVRG